MGKFEHFVVDRIDSHRDEIVQLSSNTVKISSENPPGDTTELASFVGQHL